MKHSVSSIMLLMFVLLAICTPVAGGPAFAFALCTTAKVTCIAAATAGTGGAGIGLGIIACESAYVVCLAGFGLTPTP